MISTISKIQVELSGRTYQFLCENDSPLIEVHEALSSMMKLVVEKITEAQLSQEVSDDGREQSSPVCSEGAV